MGVGGRPPEGLPLTHKNKPPADNHHLGMFSTSLHGHPQGAILNKIPLSRQGFSSATRVRFPRCTQILYGHTLFGDKGETKSCRAVKCKG